MLINSQNGIFTPLACSEMKPPINSNAISLSPRQKECLRLIAEGNTASAAAQRLKISTRMVRYHLFAARSKLQALSTPQAVHLASQLGLLDKED